MAKAEQRRKAKSVNHDCCDVGDGERRPDSGRNRSPDEDGLCGASHYGCATKRVGGGGQAHRLRHPRTRSAARRADGAPHQRALQAGGANVSARGDDRSAGERRRNRRQGSRGHGRPLLGGIARADLRCRGDGQQSWRESLARRRFQAAQLALHLPGPGRGSAQTCCAKPAIATG